MNVSGIRPYAGFYSYNSIRLNELRNQQISAAEAEGTKVEPVKEEPKVEVKVEQNFSSYDFAQTYDPTATYELKGEDSDINKLDVQKAVSDLEKDQVLMQYQYFVGDSVHVAQKQSDPTERSLRSGENFFL